MSNALMNIEHPTSKEFQKTVRDWFHPSTLVTWMLDEKKYIKMQLQNRSPRFRSLVLAALISHPMYAHAYEVWMGTLGWEQGLHDHPAEWSRTAALVEGLNVNWAPGQKDGNHLNKSLRCEVVARFTKAKDHAYQVTPHGSSRVTDEKDWQGLFDRAAGYGYKLEYLYTYSAGPGKNWKPEEHELMRKWLDKNKHGDVKIAFNGRSGHGQLERPVVQGGGIECDLTSWKENKGGRHELLRWMADPNNPATQGEKIFIHCHLNFGKGSNEADLVDAWAGARRMVRDIGRDVLNTEELRKVSNPGAAMTYSLSIGADAAATRLFQTYSIPAAAAGVTDSVRDHWWEQWMEAAEILTLTASVNNQLVIVINGYEYTLG